MNIYNKMLLFESFNEIEVLCQKYDIRNYTINSDGTIDVDGSVYLSGLRLTKLPLKFREVTGYFSCGENNLTILEGAPKSVGGYFYCSNNKLTTLEGAPQSVDGHFLCYNNSLSTLEGAPQSVGGYFYCVHNKLTTLEGAPQSVGGNFYCENNKLTSLLGAPNSVRNFYCSGNSLDPIRKLFPDDTTFYKLYKEWNFFAGGNKIYKHRFLEAMLDIGKKRLPKSITGYEYI